MQLFQKNSNAMKKIVLTLVSLFVLLPFLSLAHEGHGVVNTGPGHYVLSPEHAIPLVLAFILIGYFLGKKILKKTRIHHLQSACHARIFHSAQHRGHRK